MNDSQYNISKDQKFCTNDYATSSVKLSPTFDKTISLVCASVQFILHVTLTPSRSITNHSSLIRIFEILFFEKKRGKRLLLDKKKMEKKQVLPYKKKRRKTSSSIKKKMETKQVFPYKKKRRKTSSSILWNPTTHFRSGVGWPASTVKRRLTGRTCETFNTIQLTFHFFILF